MLAAGRVVGWRDDLVAKLDGPDDAAGKNVK